jgi:hypothetical protein
MQPGRDSGVFTYPGPARGVASGRADAFAAKPTAASAQRHAYRHSRQLGLVRGWHDYLNLCTRQISETVSNAMTPGTSLARSIRTKSR